MYRRHLQMATLLGIACLMTAAAASADDFRHGGRGHEHAWHHRHGWHEGYYVAPVTGYYAAPPAYYPPQPTYYPPPPVYYAPPAPVYYAPAPVSLTLGFR